MLCREALDDGGAVLGWLVAFIIDELRGDGFGIALAVTL